MNNRLQAFDDANKKTYTVDEIQDMLNISRTTAYNLVALNLFKVIRIGKSIRILKTSFDEWLESAGELKL